MFWADEIADDIIEKYPEVDEFIIRDEKTLSGRVHVGSLRGVVIHGIITQVLNEKGKKARFIYEFNDFDPMDGLPADLADKGYDKYMGMTLLKVPSPDGKAKNFPEFYGQEFLGVIKELGFYPETPHASDMYQEGKMNDWLRLALTKNNEIREIYKRISGSDKPEGWFPVSVVCENCHRIGSTDVISFDGEKVKYVCRSGKVSWSEGCDHEGEVSPFDGNAKLTWKTEWPAKWDVYNVTIEGAGKDHNAAGGSHDIGETICDEVSKTDVPYNIPYEFFLIGGKKMSSSKGLGQTARDVADQLPPEMLRFLMVKSAPLKIIEFDPTGDTIPRLYDQHDEAAAMYFKEGEKSTLEADTARAFELAQISSEKPTQRFLPRFSQIVFIIQIPRLDVYQEVEKMKGSALTEADKEEIDLRVKYARHWLDTHAPDKYRYELQDELPTEAHTLKPEQQNFLKELGSKLAAKSDWVGEDIHLEVHNLVKATEGIEPKTGFQALYKIFLGKDFGPQVGWFLSALEKDFVVSRLQEAAELTPNPELLGPQVKPERLEDEHFRISPEAAEKFPELQIAYAIVEGVKVEREVEALEKLKTELLPTPEAAKETLENAPIIESYKDLYRKMGVDPTKRKPTSAAMLDRIAKEKGLYKINNVVDVLNLLTVQDGISFGAFDADQFQHPITFDLSNEGDEFLPLMEEKTKRLQAGELCMFDANHLAMNRDYNYRDSDITKITPETTNVFIAFDGLDPLPIEETKAKLEKAMEHFTGVCGGTVKTIVVK